MNGLNERKGYLGVDDTKRYLSLRQLLLERKLHDEALFLKNLIIASPLEQLTCLSDVEDEVNMNFEDEDRLMLRRNRSKWRLSLLQKKYHDPFAAIWTYRTRTMSEASQLSEGFPISDTHSVSSDSHSTSVSHVSVSHTAASSSHDLGPNTRKLVVEHPRTSSVDSLHSSSSRRTSKSISHDTSPARTSSSITATRTTTTTTTTATAPRKSQDSSSTRKSVSQFYEFVGMHYIFDHHKGPITAVRFAHNSKELLAMSSADGSISICNAFSVPRVLHMLTGHSGPVLDIRWSSTNDFLLSISTDGTLRAWDPHVGKQLRLITPAFSPVSLASSPSNDNVVIVGTNNGRVLVVSLSTGKEIARSSASVSNDTAFRCIDMTEDGKCVFAGSGDGILYAFRVPEKSRNKTVKMKKAKRGTNRSSSSQPASSLSISSKSSSASRTSSSSSSGKMKMMSKKIISPQRAPLLNIVYTPWILPTERTPVLLISAGDSRIRLIRLRNAGGHASNPHSEVSFSNTFAVETSGFGSEFAVRAEFCPLVSMTNGAGIVTGSTDNSVYLFNLLPTSHALSSSQSSSKADDSSSPDSSSSPAPINVLQAHSSPVLSVSFSYDEVLLASGDASGVCLVWKREMVEGLDREALMRIPH